MNADRFSRRAVLKGLGASAAMLPLIHAERALGATATGFPKRFVAVTWTNGVIADSFFPAGPELTLGATLAPLERWKAKVLVPAGLDLKVLLDINRTYDGHFSFPSLLSGTADNRKESRKALGPSLDQFLSDAFAKKVSLPAPLLNIGVRSVGDGEPTSWRAAGQKNVPEIDPYRLFDRLFAGASLPTGQIDQLRQRRASVLDFLNKDLTGFGLRLGTEDRLKIAAHMDSVRELERRLQAAAPPAAASCTAPIIATRGTTLDTPATMKMMFDLLAVALRCDLTRVATVDIYDDGGGDGNSFPWLNVNRDYHAVAHAGKSASADKIKIDSWLFSNVANLVQQLDDTVEAGGTALDHSVILTANDMNDGADHSVAHIPFLLVGSGGGYFKTGRVVSFPKVPHNRLLASICNAMDVPVTGFGAAGYEGTLPELSA